MKMSYSESDTRANFIDPKLKKSKWEAHNIKKSIILLMVEKLFEIKDEIENLQIIYFLE